MNKTAELRTISISELRPAEYNPRVELQPGDKDYEDIKRSIQRFGFADPLAIVVSRLFSYQGLGCSQQAFFGFGGRVP